MNSNTLTVLIKRLREKLGGDPQRMIKTVRGIGYKAEDGMKHNQKKTAFLFLWLFICMLVCLGTGLLAVSRSEASFYKRAAVMAACAPEKAGEMMRSLKREQPEKVEKGEALLKQYGYEAGLIYAGGFCQVC